MNGVSSVSTTKRSSASSVAAAVTGASLAAPLAGIGREPPDPVITLYTRLIPYP
jgi:hypothetical protein